MKRTILLAVAILVCGCEDRYNPWDDTQMVNTNNHIVINRATSRAWIVSEKGMVTELGGLRP